MTLSPRVFPVGAVELGGTHSWLRRHALSLTAPDATKRFSALAGFHHGEESSGRLELVVDHFESAGEAWEGSSFGYRMGRRVFPCLVPGRHLWSVAVCPLAYKTFGETFPVRDREGEEPFINLTGLGIGNGMTVPEIQYQYYTEVGLSKSGRRCWWQVGLVSVARGKDSSPEREGGYLTERSALHLSC